MYVPTSHKEVMKGGSPVVGDPSEAYAAVMSLSRALSQGREFVALVSDARSSIAQNTSRAVYRLNSELSRRVISHALPVLESIEAGESAFREYGEQVEEIHWRARQLGLSFDSQLEEVRWCAARIELIAGVLGIGISSGWDAGVPLLAPEIPVRGGESVGHLLTESGQRESLATEWRVAAARWREALEQIGQLQLMWRALLNDRVEVERQFVAKLHLTDRGHGLNTGSGSSTIAVGRAGGAAFAMPAGRSGSAGINPTERRGHPLLESLYRNHISGIALTGDQVPVPAVERWWAALGNRDKRTLIAEVPLVIGNLDGVPLESRIKANSISARYFAKAEGIGPEEARYWERVSAGAVKLVVSDPKNSRIVEMLGEIRPQTERVITYLPGTTSQMKHFYSGEAQQVAGYLVNRFNDSTVAFVYKDGSWVSWLGSGSNMNYDRLEELGEQLADFQKQVIGRDRDLHDAIRVAVAHSAGMSIVSGAEIAGAQFDGVLSLGGAFTLKEWQPNPDTSYHHFQYDNDAINLIDRGRLRTPNELTEVFRAHKYPSAGLGRLENHSRIADGSHTNGEALKEMVKTLEEEL